MIQTNKQLNSPVCLLRIATHFIWLPYAIVLNYFVRTTTFSLCSMALFKFIACWSYLINSWISFFCTSCHFDWNVNWFMSLRRRRRNEILRKLNDKFVCVFFTEKRRSILSATTFSTSSNVSATTTNTGRTIIDGQHKHGF